MARLIEIDSDTKKIMIDAIADLIDQVGLSCRLYYPPRLIPCTNCSNGYYVNGGPMPFTFGVCPLCNSQGVHAEEVYSDVVFLINWQPKAWTLPIENNYNIRSSHGFIQTKGYIKDLPSVRQCNYLKVMDIEGYGEVKYKLKGEAVDNASLAAGYYFFALWERTLL